MRVGGDLVTLPAKILQDPTLLGNGDSRVLWGGVLGSIICFAFALTNVYKLALAQGLASAAAVRAVALLAAFPFAIFFGVAYSESLFLLCCTGTVLAWRRGTPRRAIVWGVLAGLSRSNGWTLSLALLLDLLADARRRSQLRTWLLPATAPVLGALAFSLYVFGVTGSPSEWIKAQEGWAGNVSPLAFFTRRWSAVMASGLMEYVSTYPVDAATFAAVCLSLILGMVYAYRRQWLYAALVAGYLFPALLIDLPAAGRMTSVLFPTFLMMGHALRGWSFLVVLGVFAVGQAYFASEYFSWRPPF